MSLMVKLNSQTLDVPLGDPTSAVSTGRIAEYLGSQHQEQMEYYRKQASSLLGT
jgi:hypothetical protein